jgi:hypothetical protein
VTSPDDPRSFGRTDRCGNLSHGPPARARLYHRRHVMPSFRTPSDSLATDAALHAVVSYLAQTDAREAATCDAVVGFGMFDLALPRFCGDLYVRGDARLVVFTGGIGAGTGDLGGPEADVWRAELRRSHPEIPDAAVITESRSTNTGENVAFTARLLAADHPDRAFGRGLRRVLVVASPTRLRRVWLTMRRQQPDVQVVRCLPPWRIDVDRALYTAQGIDYLAHVLGELDRLERYAERDWIVSDPIPASVARARGLLEGYRLPATDYGR